MNLYRGIKTIQKQNIPKTRHWKRLSRTQKCHTRLTRMVNIATLIAWSEFWRNTSNGFYKFQKTSYYIQINGLSNLKYLLFKHETITFSECWDNGKPSQSVFLSYTILIEKKSHRKTGTGYAWAGQPRLSVSPRWVRALRSSSATLTLGATLPTGSKKQTPI